MAKVLSKFDIENLARVCWENTGLGEWPVLPPGHQWVDAGTGKPIPEEELISAWEQVRAKDIYRRQAAAVAVALGFELGKDIKIRPRGLSGKRDDLR